MLVPADAAAGFEGLGDLGLVAEGGSGDLEEPGEKDRARFVGEDHRLFGIEAEFSARRVVAEISRRRLRREPFADIALGGPGALGERRRIAWAGRGQRLVEAELVPDQDERGIHRRAHIAEHAADELVEFCFVERLRFKGGVHLGLLCMGSRRA
jgi:hypothetical protein